MLAGSIATGLPRPRAVRPPRRTAATLRSVGESLGTGFTDLKCGQALFTHVLGVLTLFDGSSYQR
jgi:hypothetical protein